MTLVDFCLDRADVCAMPGLPIDPLPDGNRIVSNKFDRNASDSSSCRTADRGNCFAHNRPRGAGGTMLPSCHRARATVRRALPIPVSHDILGVDANAQDDRGAPNPPAR